MLRIRILEIVAMISVVYWVACGNDGDAKDNGNQMGNEEGTDAGSRVDSGLDAASGGGSEVDGSSEQQASDESTDEEPGNEEPCWPSDGVDRSHLSDVGTTEPLDYGDPALWACHPDHETDYCHTNIDATEVLKDNSYELVHFERASDPEFDCFYVYPTVLLSGESQQTDFSDIGIVSDPLIAQAVPFTRICEVYAPLYRQVGISLSSGLTGTNPALGLQDVRDAFAYYLENLNQGRNFVLMGHSQGTSMLTIMMQRDVDENPEVLSKMISALLIGGRVSVAEGERTGGTFKNIPLCNAPGDTGCVITYSSYSKEVPPSSLLSSLFAQEGTESACTNPALLAGNQGRFRGSYLRTAFCNQATFAPDELLPEEITTTYALYRDIIRGECVNRDGQHYLEISVEQSDDDAREPLVYKTSTVEAIGMGLHLVDYNLPLEDLLDAVMLQADAMP